MEPSLEVRSGKDNANSSSDVAQSSSVQEPPAKRTKTASLSEAFSMLLDDEKFHDISLQAKDDTIVAANRFALSTRSPVFQSMLFGNFQEKSSGKVKVNYDGSVVQSLVQYIHKDEAEIFNIDNDIESVKEREIQHLTSLIDAANYYNLPDLSAKAVELIGKILRQKRELAEFTLDICVALDLPNALKEIALQVLLNAESFDIGNPDDVGKLSVGVLQEILKFKNTPMDEFQLFQILNGWAHYGREGDNININRQPMATESLKYLRLNKIHPVKLSTVVKSSGFVSSEQLCDAFECQALQAAMNGSRRFDKPRALPVWKSTLTREVEDPPTKLHVLNSKPIWEGKYTWTIETVKCADITLGIVLLPTDLSSDQLVGDVPNSWGCDMDGDCYYKGQIADTVFQSFESGSKVTLTLDLGNQETINGGLSLRVSTFAHHALLFENLRQHLSPNKGFVPAVSLGGGKGEIGPNHIRLLDFKRIA